MSLYHEGVQIDHVNVIVEKVNDDLAGDARGQRADGRKHSSFRHVAISRHWLSMSYSGNRTWDEGKQMKLYSIKNSNADNVQPLGGARPMHTGRGCGPTAWMATSRWRSLACLEPTKDGERSD